MVRSKNDLRRYRSWIRKVRKDAVKERGAVILQSEGGLTSIHPDGRLVLMYYLPKGRSAGQRKRNRDQKKITLIHNSLDRIEARIDQALKILGNWG